MTMEKHEIAARNALIAVFMGGKIKRKDKKNHPENPFNKPTWWFPNEDLGHFELEYHTSWDWQIPAWSKLVKLSQKLAQDEVNADRHIRMMDQYESAICNNSPQKGFDVIVAFITWYNA